MLKSQLHRWTLFLGRTSCQVSVIVTWKLRHVSGCTALTRTRSTSCHSPVFTYITHNITISIRIWIRPSLVQFALDRSNVELETQHGTCSPSCVFSTVVGIPPAPSLHNRCHFSSTFTDVSGGEEYVADFVILVLSIL